MSQQPVTLEDIFALFRESERERLAFQESFQKSFQQSMEEHRRNLEEQRRNFEEEMAGYRRQAEEEMADLRKTVANTNKQVGAISNRWGEFVENLVKPAAVRLLQERGIQVHFTAMNVDNGQIEIDILAENTNQVVAIEVKSFLEAKDVKKFIQTLEQFKVVFPKYKSYHLYGAMAGIKVGKKAESAVIEAGLFLIQPAGNTVTIVNDVSFRPCLW